MTNKNVYETENEYSVSKFVDVSLLPKEGRRYPNFFNSTELRSLAEAVDGAVLQKLEIEIELSPLNRDRIRVCGRIRADVAQQCVVTLEPVNSTLDEQFDTEFWPIKQYLRWANTSEDEKTEIIDALKEVDPEPYDDKKIDLGQFIYETIVASINPYPRQSDVEFDWGTSEFNSRGTLKPQESGPFSKLGALKESLKHDKSD